MTVVKKSVKKAVIVLTAVAIFLVGGFAVHFMFSDRNCSVYYAQIDNSKMEERDSKGGVIDLKGNLPYFYTLLTYDEIGNEKTISFGASKPLKEGAFICLEVMPVRGVVSWSEVQYEALPGAVQDHYTALSPSNNTE